MRDLQSELGSIKSKFSKAASGKVKARALTPDNLGDRADLMSIGSHWAKSFNDELSEEAGENVDMVGELDEKRVKSIV